MLIVSASLQHIVIPARPTYRLLCTIRRFVSDLWVVFISKLITITCSHFSVTIKSYTMYLDINRSLWIVRLSSVSGKKELPKYVNRPCSWTVDKLYNSYVKAPRWCLHSYVILGRSISWLIMTFLVCMCLSSSKLNRQILFFEFLYIYIYLVTNDIPFFPPFYRHTICVMQVQSSIVMAWNLVLWQCLIPCQKSSG